MSRAIVESAQREAAWRRNLGAAVIVSAAIHAGIILSLRVEGGWENWSAHHIGFEGPTEILPEINPPDYPIEEQERLAAQRTLAGAIVDSRIAVVPEPGEAPVAVQVRPTGRRGRDRVQTPVIELTENFDLRSASEATSRSSEFVIERMVRPEYPRSAIQREAEGIIRVQAQVDPEGRVLSVVILTTNADPDLVESTRSAMTRWKFRPYLVDGRPVEFSVLVPFRFRLE